MRKFFVFIDESGTKEIEDSTQNIFCLCGVIIEDIHLEKVKSNFNDLLSNYFKTNIPELKSNWFRNPKERKKRYLKPYNLTEKMFRQFTLDFYELLSNSDLKLISSAVNKKRIREDYKYPFNPNALAYELFAQRLANFGTQYNCFFEIFYDEFPEGKTKAKNNWQDLLAKQHAALLKGKTILNRTWKKRSCMDYSALPEKINFIKSHDYLLIQIADICAYNIRKQADNFYGKKSKISYEYYKKIRLKIHCCPRTKKVAGFGFVIHPK